MFQSQQLHFPVYSSGISGQAAVGADNSMTWNDRGNEVVAYCSSDSLRGHPGQPFLLCNLCAEDEPPYRLLCNEYPEAPKL